jgi:hypothetical protein
MARFTNIRAFWEGLDAGAAERRREEELALKKKKEDQDFLFRQSADDRANSAELRTTEDFNLARVGKQNVQDKAIYDGETFKLAAPTLRATQALDIERQNKLNEFRVNNTATEFENLKKAGELKLGGDAQLLGNEGRRQAAVNVSPATADGKTRALAQELFNAGKINKEQAELMAGVDTPTAFANSPYQTGNYIANSTTAIGGAVKQAAALQAGTEKYENQVGLQTLKNDGTQAVADTRAQSAETIAAGKVAAKGGVVRQRRSMGC